MGSVSPALFGLSLFLLKLPACLILRWIHTSAIAVLQNKRLNKYNYSAIDEQFIFYRSDGLKKFDPSDPNSPLPNFNRFTSRDQLSFAYTYLKLQRLNPDRPLRLYMFKDCERRALTKLFHLRVDSSPLSPPA